jgi:hypothetical protein
LKAGADGQEWHQFKADDARDEAEAAAQSGQYPRWRRRVEAVWLAGGAAPDTRRHARTRARTARLSALTHLSPTFGPEIGRPTRVCLFASARWGVFSLFFLSAWTRSNIEWVGPLEISLDFQEGIVSNPPIPEVTKRAMGLVRTPNQGMTGQEKTCCRWKGPHEDKCAAYEWF